MYCVFILYTRLPGHHGNQRHAEQDGTGFIYILPERSAYDTETSRLKKVTTFRRPRKPDLANDYIKEAPKMYKFNVQQSGENT